MLAVVVVAVLWPRETKKYVNIQYFLINIFSLSIYHCLEQLCPLRRVRIEREHLWEVNVFRPLVAVVS